MNNMNDMLRISACFVALISLPANSMDTAAMRRWASARVVKYHVEGVHSARASVVHGDYEGKADVTDRITVEFTWDVSKARIVGPVTFKDSPSELKNIKSDGTNCPPPQLSGEYEHFQSASSSTASSDLIQITGTRTYPPAKVSNYPGGCSMRAIPGAREPAVLSIAAVEPAMLAMPVMQGGPVSIAADRKSFSLMGADHWKWTYTPTIVQ